jgi:hypothetical protein
VPTLKNAKLYNDLIQSLKDWAALNVVKKDANNTFNKGNTAAKNLFKSFMQEEAFPAKTKVVIDGAEYMWATAESNVIDVRKWHKLFVEKEITEAQYFDGLRVSKEDAVLSIGEDQVATISSVQSGKTADIRFNGDNAGTKKGIEIVLPAGIKPPSGGIKPRLGVPLQVPARPLNKRLIVVPKGKASVGR